MPTIKRPSMADVAAEAGVSHQTVSRVLNGHAYVRDDTRDRVLAAIRALGYRPNQAARTLATSRSATIGIVTAGTTHYGPASTVLAIEEAARESGYFVSMAALSPRGPGAAAVLDQLITQGVDGIVVVAPLVDVARLVDEVSPRIPVVVVASRRDAPDGSSVCYAAVDQWAGAARVTQHLVDLGHARMAHIAGPSGWFDALERSRGFSDVTERAGAQGSIIPADGWSAQHGYDVGARLAGDIVRGAITAVFAGNDYLALGVTRALWERGLRVPGDVSIAGFDDIEGSGFLVPSLTTVRQPFARLGAAAVQGLIDAWGGTRAPEGTRIDPEIVVRDSTAPPEDAGSASRV